jgi:hypothetical protein
MDACPQCTPPHVVKAGKARGQQRWRCRGGGYQCTCTTPPWETPMATIAGRLSLLSRRLDECLGKDVWGVDEHDRDLDSPRCR